MCFYPIGPLRILTLVLSKPLTQRVFRSKTIHVNPACEPLRSKLAIPPVLVSTRSFASPASFRQRLSDAALAEVLTIRSGSQYLADHASNEA